MHIFVVFRPSVMSPNISAKFMLEIKRILSSVIHNQEKVRHNREGNAASFATCIPSVGAIWVLPDTGGIWLPDSCSLSQQIRVQHVSKKKRNAKGDWLPEWHGRRMAIAFTETARHVQNAAKWFAFVAGVGKPWLCHFFFSSLATRILMLERSDLLHYIWLQGNGGALGINGQEAEYLQLLWLQATQIFTILWCDSCANAISNNLWLLLTFLKAVIRHPPWTLTALWVAQHPTFPSFSAFHSCTTVTATNQTSDQTKPFCFLHRDPDTLRIAIKLLVFMHLLQKIL